MYRIKVLSSGKYHNVVGGNRYFFFRKSAVEFANDLAERECDFKIEKLVHVGDCFFWTEGEEETKIWWEENEEEKIHYYAVTRKEYNEWFK